MSVAFRKVWRDLWNYKGRTLLVVLSIAVGVLAVGMITASNTLIIRQMGDSQQASHPSHVILPLRQLIDDDTVLSLAHMPEVAEAEGMSEAGIRWKPTLDSAWQDATVIARADYGQQTFDLVELRSGQWPASKTAAIEFNHVEPYHVPGIGGTVYFEVNNRPKPITIAGIVRDPGQFPPPFAQTPTFYVTRDTLEQLVGWRNFNQVRFTIPIYSKPDAQVAADAVEKKLLKIGVSAGVPTIQDPKRHALQDVMDGVGLVLVVMAIVSLGLSTILVVNTINAVVAQQVPQIGIMKTIGGLSPQIATLYLAGVAVYGLLSLGLAVPLGAWGGQALSAWLLTVLNIPAAPFELLRASLLYQISTGLVTPLLAALWPIVQGVSISVREALSAYGLGTGRYGKGPIDRVLGKVHNLPRMAALSLRNTFRRAGRVALTELTLIAAGAIFMMVLSTHYSFNKSIEQIFKSFGFDVVVGFEQPQRIDKMEPLIESRPGVAHAEMWVWQTGKIKLPGAKGPGAEYDIRLRGVPADTEVFKPELTAGRSLRPGDRHALLLNQKLAGDMHVGVGDQVALDLDEGGKSTWTVVGLIFDLGARQQTAYVYRDILNQELNHVGRATVVEIQTQVKTRSAQEIVEKELRDYFKSQSIALSFTDTGIKNQEQANAQFSILTTLLLIMTFLIAIVGSFGLSGTLSINVLERRREIGVMRAVGASSLDVAQIFMGEGLLLGLISWAQAVPLSLLAGRYFVEAIGRAIDFPAVYHYSTSAIWLWLAIVVVLSLLASGLPARRATQISVRESLAYE
ncbi:MAG: ABC transporter permease [Chloroflexi bacterium]|nr:ABC transporter permease [Chloroflexota bacterium]